MKNIYPIVVIFLVSILGLYIDFPVWLNIGLIFSLFIALLMAEISVFFHTYTGDFQMRSFRKKISRYTIFMGLLFLGVLTLRLIENKTEEFIKSSDIIFFIWVFIMLVEFITFFIYKKRKPVTLVIDKNTLIFFSTYVQKRDLKKLKHIDFTTFGNDFRLIFEKKADIQIPFNEYEKADFRQFLEILLDKSEHDLKLTEEMEKVFPALE
ncbi:hypothetical protein C8N46_102465 [Kordia periserrulae]|uniref:Uncharacterized protein n=1 Tax=Kordia periserrulae TaxID=701523 RepID=A0A2T6C452_9FLAO|nr:hypothetical protein [Kordia periserrulae]PTX63063.1 hypothetical protein C8N46_102465 [Kordia periserrulae]